MQQENSLLLATDKTIEMYSFPPCRICESNCLCGELSGEIHTCVQTKEPCAILCILLTLQPGPSRRQDAPECAI
eukprot:363214-Amphidinium_carterae.1